MTKLIKLALVSTLLVGSLSSYAFETTASLGASSFWAQLISTIQVSSSDIEQAEYNAVKDDAANFLANDEASDALSAFISDIRSSNENFKGFSDKEIALAIVNQ